MSSEPFMQHNTHVVNDDGDDDAVSAAPSGQAYEIMKELGTNVQLLPNHTTPQKSDTYFNRKMKNNRSLRW